MLDRFATLRRLYSIIVLSPIALSGCIPVDRAVTQPNNNIFQETSLAPGIKMWTNAAKKTYIIEADLSKNELRSISGAPTPTGKVGQMKFEEFWAKNQRDGALQVLVNGTFFQEYNKPTGIAFGLKQDNQLITYGYGLNEFPTETTTVSWSSAGISIEPYSRSTFDGAMSTVVGALATTAGKNAAKPLPRTFIGVKGWRADKKAYSTVLLFSSPSATQSAADRTLRQFGAERVAMLDGGQSTGLIVGGNLLLKPKTRLPQTIGIFSK